MITTKRWLPSAFRKIVNPYSVGAVDVSNAPVIAGIRRTQGHSAVVSLLMGLIEFFIQLWQKELKIPHFFDVVLEPGFCHFVTNKQRADDGIDKPFPNI